MKNKLLKVFLFLSLLFIGIGTVHAEDTKFIFSIGGAKDVKAGDEFTVDVTVTGPNEAYSLNGFDLDVVYDTSKLTLLEGAPNNKIIRPEQGSINSDLKITTIKFRVNDGATESKSNLELKPVSVIKDGEEVIGKKNEKDLVGFNGSTVLIRNIGTDNTLKSLKIPNTVLTPEFNKNVHDYKATVTDVNKIEVKAEPTDGHATVWTNGVDGNLQKGENDVVIACKSESGQENLYTIKVTLNVTPTEAELKAADTTLSGLTIKGQKIEFTPTEKKYYISVDYETTKINVTATPTNPNAVVEITGNTKFVVGKSNIVKINVTSEDKTKTDTYQIIVTREEEKKEIVKTCPDETSNREWIIFTASLAVIFTLGIILGYVLGKKDVFGKLFKKKNKTEEAVEINTLSDTIDLSDTVKKTASASKKDEEIETIETEK
ncbi:MAG: cadherin-like beta sandwich domain-containing protein [Bacilli bacterium]|nr:cadherin-like beta sandwich domain-containing protein [Bacilli bacterium]